MLTLKRRRGQVVQIGSDIVVQVVSIEKGAVILGITAPSETKISRPDDEPRDDDSEHRIVRT